ncbi:MAG: DNA polymerase I [Candidatus Kerfeldbacteria bacterium]|nr:DNA polymerase I [Candidatus Kerfeldbacteria bacterium]
MTAKHKRFVIIDGNALVHRAFHALPHLTSPQGAPVNAVYGFALVLLKMLKELKPEYVAATFDAPGKTFRHEAYAAYKATRVKAPQELYDQIPMVKELVESFSIPVVERSGFEADDLIGTLARQAEGVETVIVTGDLDTLQLVDDHTKVYTLRKGMGETVTYDAAAVRERFGFGPDQLIDYKALRGDPSDNLPGVRGIGEKTAGALLQQFGTIEHLYEALKHETPKAKKLPAALREKLLKGEKDARRSKELATIVRTVPVQFRLAAAARSRYDRQKVVGLLRAYGFSSLLSKIPQDEESAQAVLALAAADEVPRRKGQTYTLVQTKAELAALLSQLKGVDRAAVDTETTGLDPFSAALLGVSIAWERGKAYFVSVRGELLPDALKPFLEDGGVAKVGHNLKYDYQVLRHHGIELRPLAFDSMVASYLLNAGTRQHNLNAAVFAEFGYEMMPIEALIGKRGKQQRAMADVPVEKLSWYSCEDADFTFRLAEAFLPKLRREHLERLFLDMEMPLVGVLARMEEAGVLVDVDHLKTLSRTLGKKLATLEGKITKLAGGPFNVNSPAQLKEVLFEKLRIPTEGLGRTKTGISTGAGELEKLKDQHPIIPLIGEFREFAKLKSTYLDALPELVGTDGRIHTSFNQTVAATGRLSSSDPNLQNIPIRTEWGRKIRQAFVAPPRHALISADYSQFELRIVASLANDEKMLEAFRTGEDIHARTAAEIHGVPIEKVTPEMRRDAKTVNFGIIYGLGPVGLAEGSGMSRDEARAFIEKYFAVYEGVANYLEETKALAHKRGFVETLFGRRRKLPDIHSRQPMVRAGAERMAINMPVQGTQADVIKMAMVALDQGLPDVSAGTRMLLQVHDELVFEVPEKDTKKVSAYVKEVMEGVHKFKTPVVVEVHTGSNWDEAH